MGLCGAGGKREEVDVLERASFLDDWSALQHAQTAKAEVRGPEDELESFEAHVDERTEQPFSPATVASPLPSRRGAQADMQACEQADMRVQSVNTNMHGMQANPTSKSMVRAPIIHTPHTLNPRPQTTNSE